MAAVSIVICAYNSDQRLLSRCLGAIALLDGLQRDCEVILVDNNSSPPLQSYAVVQEAMTKIPRMQVVVEQQQGIYHARKAGIQASQGEFIVFFDDDNEPASNYLQALSELRKKYPCVGAWGPGKVQVDYIDGIDPALKPLAQRPFQQRDDSFLSYACVRRWEDCYPYGTGLAIHRRHALLYMQLADRGQLTFTGREGQSLSSGDDTQLVLCCIINHAAAGRSPHLSICHMIPGNRANFAYLKKLIYGTHISYDVIIKQILPEHPVNFGAPLKSDLHHSIRAIKKYIQILLFRSKSKTLRTIESLALLSSAYAASGKSTPPLIQSVLDRLTFSANKRSQKK